MEGEQTVCLLAPQVPPSPSSPLSCSRLGSSRTGMGQVSIQTGQVGPLAADKIQRW